MTPVMMACGHSANATSQGKPACAICGVVDQVVATPDLNGRRARCSYYGKQSPIGRRLTQNVAMTTCTAEVDSNPAACFFEHRPAEEFDRFYCGCWGDD